MKNSDRDDLLALRDNLLVALEGVIEREQEYYDLLLDPRYRPENYDQKAKEMEEAIAQLKKLYNKLDKAFDLLNKAQDLR